MKGITPCLWFDSQAEEAAKFYVSIFKNSMILGVSHYGEAAAKSSGRPKGSVMTVVFELDGQKFLGLNGGPDFQFTPAISLMANCETQKEVDELWEKLSAGGATDQCGWLRDKYGVSWQIVPTVMGKLLQQKDGRKTDRVMEALLPMTKLDVKTIEKAYEQA